MLKCDLHYIREASGPLMFSSPAAGSLASSSHRSGSAYTPGQPPVGRVSKPPERKAMQISDSFELGELLTEAFLFDSANAMHCFDRTGISMN